MTSPTDLVPYTTAPIELVEYQGEGEIKVVQEQQEQEQQQATARESSGEHLVPATRPAPVSEECLVPRPQEQIAVAPRPTLPEYIEPYQVLCTPNKSFLRENVLFVSVSAVAKLPRHSNPNTNILLLTRILYCLSLTFSL